jgi:hypothetical protein
MSARPAPIVGKPNNVLFAWKITIRYQVSEAIEMRNVTITERPRRRHTIAMTVAMMTARIEGPAYAACSKI